MINIRRICEHDAALLREIRLRALSDSPMAFGSTYAREVAFDDREWEARAKRLRSSADTSTFFAFDGDACRGIIGCFRNTEQPTAATIVSMWVAPEARRGGAGAKLLQAVEQWATQQGFAHLHLSVVETNLPAVAFYEACGFKFTGKTEPYPNDRTLCERYMAKPLQPAQTV